MSKHLPVLNMMALATVETETVPSEKDEAVVRRSILDEVMDEVEVESAAMNLLSMISATDPESQHVIDLLDNLKTAADKFESWLTTREGELKAKIAAGEATLFDVLSMLDEGDEIRMTTIVPLVVELEKLGTWVGGPSEHEGGSQHFKLKDGRVVTPRCACGKQKACVGFTGYTIDS